VTDYVLEGDVGVITLNSPPVNALSAAVRDGLSGGMAKAIADPGAKAVVLICEGRTFIAGADITEFGGASKGASLFDVQNAMEGSPKPVVAAIHGSPSPRPGAASRKWPSACCQARAAPSACRVSSAWKRPWR
jgi:3-hydroxyacyl-CoA dehydrogenase